MRLHVVLTAQRMQSGARPADVAGDRAHRDQAAAVVGAGGVLGDAHAPVDDAGTGLSRPGDLADLDVEAGDLRGQLRRVGLHGLGQLVVVGGAVRDEVAVDQAEADHLVHDPVVERHIGAGFELAEDVGVLGDGAGRASM